MTTLEVPTLDVAVTEAHTVIEPLTRQIARNIARHASKRGTRCRRCPDPVVDPASAVLDNGQVSHRVCAERINGMVDEMNYQQALARLEATGVTIHSPRLIVPGREGNSE